MLQCINRQITTALDLTPPCKSFNESGWGGVHRWAGLEKSGGIAGCGSQRSVCAAVGVNVPPRC